MLEVIDLEEKKAILKRFMDKYIKEGINTRDENGRIILLWCNLKDHYYDEYILIKTIDVPKIGLREDLPIYVYFDGNEKIYVTTFIEFCQYLVNREIWEDIDVEVFDDSLMWLLVVTHEDQSMLIGFDDDE